MKTLMLYKTPSKIIFDEIFPTETSKLFLNYKGKLVIYQEKQKFILEKNNIAFIRFGLTFKIKIKKSEPTRIHALAFYFSDFELTEQKTSPHQVYNFLSPQHQISLIKLNRFDFRFISMLFRLLDHQIQHRQNHPLNKNTQKFLLNSLLSDLDWIYQKNSFEILHPEFPEQRWIHRFFILLNEFYSLHHEVGFYASELCITGNYLYKIVKSEMGKTPKQIIQKFLLYKAKTLLSDTNYSISEISEQLGFKDAGHFSSFFKQKQNIDPSSFRKKLKQNNT